MQKGIASCAWKIHPILSRLLLVGTCNCSMQREENKLHCQKVFTIDASGFAEGPR